MILLQPTIVGNGLTSRADLFPTCWIVAVRLTAIQLAGKDGRRTRMRRSSGRWSSSRPKLERVRIQHRNRALVGADPADTRLADERFAITSERASGSSRLSARLLPRDSGRESG